MASADVRPAGLEFGPRRRRVPESQLTVRAVETLADLLGDNKHPAVRLGAARTVAEIGMHQYDAETILRKLDELEASQRRG